MALFNRNPNEVACAKELYTNYLLYELGAYNYLIYLREKPEKALEDLKKGLLRK